MQFADHLRDMRILVVDDVPVNVAVLEQILRGAGCRDIETTVSSAEALASISRRAPDLLLLDLHMPEISGYEIMNAHPQRRQDGRARPHGRRHGQRAPPGAGGGRQRLRLQAA
jgi:CheY-like chemotaxis protein